MSNTMAESQTNVFITRPEFSDRMNALTSDVRKVEADVIEIRTLQTTQQATLNEILSTVRRQGNLRSMVIAGFSGLGGGVAAGAVYLLHWLSQ
ncbi:hypothetical protein HK15_08865 [Acetobacter orientalis]|uniref:Uncharacterized protein n=1 Tax=Acetobacter orientalis TaxID=146474 RepID=A0A252BH90_9PROT|nr:hypothetical protein [Acetobacter orientalis]OUJ03867.1 hypothetical protein HK15_08865 [Acetobacter orientalis]